MSKRKMQSAKRKEIHAWAIRRREVDMTQLALAYYLLAKRRIEQRKAAELSKDSEAGEGEAA